MKLSFMAYLFIFFSVLHCKPKELEEKATRPTDKEQPSSPNGSKPNSRGVPNVYSSPNSPRLVGKITPEIKTLGGLSLVRFKINSIESSFLSRREFISLLGKESKTGRDLREKLSASIISIPGTDDDSKGIRLESPMINQKTKDLPYFYKAVPSFFSGKVKDTFKHSLVHCDPSLSGANANEKDYLTKYKKIFGYTGNIFKERGKSTEKLENGASLFFGGFNSPNYGLLITAPCPFDGDIRAPENKPLLHLRAYMGKIKNNPKRMHSFWKPVSEAALIRFKKKEDIYLNTQGRGVPYLHFRVETSPKYYSNGAEMTDPQMSQKLYEKFFTE